MNGDEAGANLTREFAELRSRVATLNAARQSATTDGGRAAIDRAIRETKVLLGEVIRRRSHLAIRKKVG